MAKIAAAKAREEREERRRAKEDKTKKDDIDDTKENVMEDLLSALQSSGPATVSYSYMLITVTRSFHPNAKVKLTSAIKLALQTVRYRTSRL